MKSKMLLFIITILLFLLNINLVNADNAANNNAKSCSQWYSKVREKYHILGIKAGIVMDEKGNWLRIYAKGTASVDFDDEDEIQDAKDEAEMKAKAALTYFLKEKLSSEKTIENISKKMKELQKISEDSEKVSVNKKSIKTKIERIQNSASSLLKGIVVLCESVENKRAEVIVGVSPKTQKIADTVRKSMNSNTSKNSPSTNDNNGNGSVGYIHKSKPRHYIDKSSNLDF